MLSVAVFPINLTWSRVCIIAKTPGLWQASAQYLVFSIANKRVNLCTVVIIAPSRVSVNVLFSFAMVRLEEEPLMNRYQMSARSGGSKPRRLLIGCCWCSR